MPGLRLLDKMAVVIGGGVNHRWALFDMILIKDNHVDAAGGVGKAIELAHSYQKEKGLNIPIVVEARNLDEVAQVLSAKNVTRLMLDNFVHVKDGRVDTSFLMEALELIQGKLPVEVSGNVNENTIAEIAKTNVDFVSIGAITHSAVAIDISLKLQPNM